MLLLTMSPPNKRLQPSTFGAGTRGSFCQQSL